MRGASRPRRVAGYLGSLGMTPSPNKPDSSGRTSWYAKSKSYRFLVEAGFAWDMTGVVVAGVVGVGALAVAIFTLSGVALACALICLPLAFILWAIAKGSRDAGRDS